MKIDIIHWIDIEFHLPANTDVSPVEDYLRDVVRKTASDHRLPIWQFRHTAKEITFSGRITVFDCDRVAELLNISQEVHLHLMVHDALSRLSKQLEKDFTLRKGREAFFDDVLNVIYDHIGGDS